MVIKLFCKSPKLVAGFDSLLYSNVVMFDEIAKLSIVLQQFLNEIVAYCSGIISEASSQLIFHLFTAIEICLQLMQQFFSSMIDKFEQFVCNNAVL